MSIGERLAVVLRGAELSPRDLSACTKVHFTTIYRLIRHRGTTFPSVEKTLSEALDKIEKLTEDGHLPFGGPISDREQRLVAMLANNN